MYFHVENSIGENNMTTYETRESTYPVLPLILSRNSSRAFSDELVTDDELFSLFEAARWAPSCYNNQPWRFVYVRKNDPEWIIFFNALVEFNQSWCKDADTLVLVVSRSHFEHNDKPATTASFDTGAAWMNLALEANARGLIAHAMQGFDYTKIKIDLAIPDHFKVEAMIALGKKGDPNKLSEKLREMETLSTRKPLDQLISRGNFSKFS